MLADQSPNKTVYKDSLLDNFCINLFTKKMAQAAGLPQPKSGYDGFVELSRQMIKGRNAVQQQALVANVLKSLVPAAGLKMVRALFSPTKLVCELNAWFSTVMFPWLVGECVTEEVELTNYRGEVVTQKSLVKIKKCRYLEESGCVGLCINMCKMPTQKFFAEEFGIPLHMKPNFEDLSCEMIFGQTAPPLEEEGDFSQPCLVARCDTATGVVGPCPKVR
jgi:hypothetical protein